MLPISAAKGRFVWHELLTTDVKGAIAFYTKVIGWETEAFQMGGDAPPYMMWKIPGGAAVGGVFPLPEEAKKMGAPPNWMGDLCVPDCDASVAKVAALGGRIMQPAFDVPTVGRVAIVADPTGAVFALYQPFGEAPGHAGPATPGDIAWCELMTTDPEAAWRFYEGLAGWKKTDSMDMGPGFGMYQMFAPPSGEAMGGMMKTPAGMSMSAWGYYVSVPNLDHAIEMAVSSGGKLMHGPTPVPGGDRVATLTDPQGAMFSMFGK